jgi:hypothetical protein
MGDRCRVEGEGEFCVERMGFEIVWVLGIEVVLWVVCV